MPRGGRRPGAGLKKGTKLAHTRTAEKEALRLVIRQRVAAEIEPLLDAQIANAKGIKYLVARDPKTGKFERIVASQVRDDAHIEVWEKDPSIQAFTDLMNRTVDKPKEQPQDLNVSGTLDILAILQQRHARHRKPE